MFLYLYCFGTVGDGKWEGIDTQPGPDENSSREPSPCSLPLHHAMLVENDDNDNRNRL